MWVACPGSVRLRQRHGLPQDTADAAAEGTAAHWVVERALKGDPQPVGALAPNGWLVTEEIKAGAQVMIDHVTKRGIMCEIEKRVTMSSIHADNWGTVDVFAIDTLKKVAYLDDLKYGFGLVEPYDNWQLTDYASGVYDIIEAMGESAVDYTFKLTIVQPRVWHRSGPIRTWTVSAPELRNRFRTLRGAAEEAMGNNPQTVTGKQCKYCPARHICPALRGATLDIVDYAADVTPVEISPRGLAVELHILTQAKARLDARLAGLEAQAMSLITSGKDVPWWAIEHTAGKKDWNKPPAEVLAMGQMYGLSLAKPIEPITPTQAEKKGVPPEIVAMFSTRKPGAAKLVQVSTSDAQRVFGGQEPWKP